VEGEETGIWRKSSQHKEYFTISILHPAILRRSHRGECEWQDRCCEFETRETQAQILLVDLKRNHFGDTA
jgi:hypothetical protein